MCTRGLSKRGTSWSSRSVTNAQGAGLGGVEGHGRPVDAEDPVEAVGGDGERPVAVVAQPALEVAQGVLVGDELHPARPGVGLDGPQVVGAVGVGVAPHLVVARVGEGVLGVELELVELPPRQAVDEGEQRLELRHPVARHVQHDAAHRQVGPVLDAAGGEHAVGLALGGVGRVAQLGQRGPGVAQAGGVGSGDAHAVVVDGQAVALGGDRGVARHLGLPVRHPRPGCGRREVPGRRQQERRPRPARPGPWAGAGGLRSPPPRATPGAGPLRP